MLLFFRLTRDVLRMRRRLPRSLLSIYRLIRYLNFIELIPCLVVMMFRPMHFYRSLPAILDGKKRIYSDPVAFTGQSILALLAMSRVARGSASGTILWSTTVATALKGYSPFYILENAVLMVPCLLVFSWMSWYAARQIGEDNGFVFRWFATHWASGYLFRVPFHPSTYKYMDWRRLCWSILYISGFYLVIYQLVSDITIVFLQEHPFLLIEPWQFDFLKLVIFFIVTLASGPFLISAVNQTCCAIMVSSRVVTERIALAHFGTAMNLTRSLSTRHMEEQLYYAKSRADLTRQSLTRLESELARIRVALAWLDQQSDKLKPALRLGSHRAVARALLEALRPEHFKRSIAISHISNEERETALRTIYIPMVSLLRDRQRKLATAAANVKEGA